MESNKKEEQQVVEPEKKEEGSIVHPGNTEEDVDPEKKKAKRGVEPDKEEDQLTEADKDNDTKSKKESESDSEIEFKSIFWLCAQVLERYPNMTLPEMKKRQEELSREYKFHYPHITGRFVDYTKQPEVTQCAYIRTNVSFHSNAVTEFINQALSKDETFGRLFLKESDGTTSVNVASIGCGPGSDMLGVLHLLRKYRFGWPNLALDRHFCFELYDSCPDWQTAIGHFDHVIRKEQERQKEQNERVGIWPSFQHSFHTWSLSQPMEATSNPCPNWGNTDLFIFAWVLSDIFRGRKDDYPDVQNTKANLVNICKSAKVGSFFMFLDTKSEWERITPFVLSTILVEAVFVPLDANFEKVHSHDGEYRLGDEEQKEDLGRFYDETAMPKIRRHVSMELYKKIDADKSQPKIE